MQPRLVVLSIEQCQSSSTPAHPQASDLLYTGQERAEHALQQCRTQTTCEEPCLSGADTIEFGLLKAWVIKVSLRLSASSNAALII